MTSETRIALSRPFVSNIAYLLVLKITQILSTSGDLSTTTGNWICCACALDQNNQARWRSQAERVGAMLPLFLCQQGQCLCSCSPHGKSKEPLQTACLGEWCFLSRSGECYIRVSGLSSFVQRILHREFVWRCDEVTFIFVLKFLGSRLIWCLTLLINNFGMKIARMFGAPCTFELWFFSSASSSFLSDVAAVNVSLLT